MHTLMFLSTSLESTRMAVERLRKMGVSEDAYSVIGRQEEGLFRHHLHVSGVWERTDLIHSGERGVILGGFAGVFFAGLMMWMQPFGVPVTLWALLACVVMFGCFGAWVGGMVGLSHENYKLAPFHQAIEDGQFLLLVGSKDDVGAASIRKQLADLNELSFAADDTSIINPLHNSAEFQLQRHS
ncbi:MAG: hypothetical protein U0998_05395 [Moraxellaceae bacterium]|nr:hypothetical protein [Moraxellaceae bacterium]MDZ4297413.1 hypothetical protein [Moraxellaceae bacterium]MDZ4386641.1 hypothetical protein [Moraxellaceae bacterium]